MFKDKTIEKRVMGVVRSIISEAQTNLERDCEAAADALIADMEAVHQKHEGTRAQIEEKHVKSVFAKLAAA